MSPDASCRPAGVVFQPLTSIALEPSWPGTLIARPETGCVRRKLSAARQTPPANNTRTSTNGQRLMEPPAASGVSAHDTTLLRRLCKVARVSDVAWSAPYLGDVLK